MAAGIRVHGGTGAEPVQRPFLRLWDGRYRRGLAQPHHLRRIEVGTATQRHSARSKQPRISLLIFVVAVVLTLLLGNLLLIVCSPSFSSPHGLLMCAYVHIYDAVRYRRRLCTYVLSIYSSRGTRRHPSSTPRVLVLILHPRDELCGHKLCHRDTINNTAVCTSKDNVHAAKEITQCSAAMPPFHFQEWPNTNSKSFVAPNTCIQQLLYTNTIETTVLQVPVGINMKTIYTAHLHSQQYICTE